VIQDDLHLLPGAVAPTRAAAPPRRVLLTGATGFVGAHVLDALLRRTRAEVVCLVRAENAAAGLARVAAAMARYGLGAADLGARVVVVTGALDQPRCGLDATRWDGLAERLDAILHAGAMLHFLRGYRALRPHNVDATRWLIALAARSGARLLHLSTVNAMISAGDCGRARVFENDPPPPFAAIDGGYARSKWVAERLVEMATEAGVAAAILRVGWVIGDAARGVVAPEQVQNRIVESCLAAGIVPAPRGAMDLVPVEYVAAAVVGLALAQPAPSGAYHLVHPAPLDAAGLRAAVAACRPDLVVLPVARWIVEMRRAAVADRAHPLAALLLGRRLGTGLAELAQRLPVFDCARLLGVLGDGLGPPPSGTALVARLVGAVAPAPAETSSADASR
jgi:thioester reductase-like protein